MSRFNGGWLKLYRSAIDEDIGKRANLLAIWVTLLCWATRFETKVIGEKGPRILPPGSVVIGMRQLSDHLGISKTNTYKWIQYLQKRGSILIEAGTHGTVITICNWDEYQGSDDGVGTQRERSENAAGTQRERRGTLNGEVKKERIKERKKYKVGILTNYPPEYISLWDAYGKIGDKRKGYETFDKLKLSPEDTASLTVAIKNYYSRKEEWKSPQHFSTFLNSDWRQYHDAAPSSPNSSGRENVFDFLPHHQEKSAK